MTGKAATEHQAKGWLVNYNDRQVRVASRPNDHNICHVLGTNFSSYAFLHELRVLTGPDGNPMVDPEFNPNQ